MGEKPGRGRKKAPWQARALQTTMPRVKVYQLEDNGKWTDQGTGHVTIDYMEGSNELVLTVLDEGDNNVLLLHNITPDDIYRKQETIISWRDPEKAVELALSFEGSVGCSYIWKNMCHIREDLKYKILRRHAVPNNAMVSLKDSRDYLFPDKSLSSVDGEVKELPPLDFSNLLAILKNVQIVLQRSMAKKICVANSISKDEERGASFQQVPNMLMTLHDLPCEMLEEVVRRLPCRADRARLRCCSKFWRDSIRNSTEPLQLPWLLLPSTVELLYYTVTGGRFSRFHPIPVQVRNLHFVGASDGDWIFLASENPLRQELFHLFSGWSIPLPLAMLIDSRSVEVKVTSAVLSGDPSSGSFMVAAIVDVGKGLNRRAAFWQDNLHVWVDCGHVAMERAGELIGEQKYLPLDMQLVDLVHINGTFWYLTSEEELVRLYPVEDWKGHLRMVAKGLKMEVREDFEAEEDMDEEVFEKGEGTITWRYLIESCGEPVMVLRNIEGCWTTGVRLFRLQCDSDKNSWQELFELPQETFFVGHGCSRSYRVGQELQVYFFHDRITRLRGRNLYWRTDSGIATQIGVLRWPVLWWNGLPVPATSDQAPPTWLLH